MKHVIITGGAGFLGSHLVDAFIERGYAVSALDNLCTGRRENLAHLKNHPQFSFSEHDVCQSIQESQLPFIGQFGLDGVLHFACPASPVDFSRIPMEILAVDSIGTFHLGQLCLDHQARFVLASTSEVYGDPLEHPQRETYWGNVNTQGERACYDETKRFAEAYVATAVRACGLRGGIVRIFNTYGPRTRPDDGRVIPELFRRARQGEPLILHGSGRQTRSFIYVSDLIDGIVRFYESTICDPVNLGNPQETTLVELAELIGATLGIRPQIEFAPVRPDDPRRRCPDITRAREWLDWQPTVSLKEGLERTWLAMQDGSAPPR